MKKLLLPALLLTVLTSTAIKPAPGTLTPDERKFAIDYYIKTRDKLLADVKGLSQNQLNWKADTGRWSVYQCTEHIALQAFLLRRDSTIEYIKTTQDDLKDHFLTHPVFGTMDLYQGLILLAAHTARHTAQLEEVMNTPGFPKN